MRTGCMCGHTSEWRVLERKFFRADGVRIRSTSSTMICLACHSMWRAEGPPVDRTPDFAVPPGWTKPSLNAENAPPSQPAGGL